MSRTAPYEYTGLQVESTKTNPTDPVQTRQGGQIVGGRPVEPHVRTTTVCEFSWSGSQGRVTFGDEGSTNKRRTTSLVFRHSSPPRPVGRVLSSRNVSRHRFPHLRPSPFLNPCSSTRWCFTKGFKGLVPYGNKYADLECYVRSPLWSDRYEFQ